jgi:hypothetical protein
MNNMIKTDALMACEVQCALEAHIYVNILFDRMFFKLRSDLKN